MLPRKIFRLPKDIPLEEYPKPEEYLQEAQHLTEEAQKQGIILRVMGPIAVHQYFPKHVGLYRSMERLGDKVFTDIDYASYGKSRGKIVPFFEKQGYELEKRAAMLSGNTRHIYFGGRIPMIDVFFDKLNYNHLIDYRNRLEIDQYCVSLADLVLQKLQIVQINDKDLKDAMLLFLAAPVSDTDKGAINGKYIASLFSEDWGFYFTAKTNLRKIKDAMASVNVLTSDHRASITDKIDQLSKYIEDAPKSGKWRGRAKTGTSKPWFQDVSDWE
jgi:hypothetical protein